MAKLLDGKVAVVTGSGRGIGRETVLALAAEGARVVVNDLGGAADGTGASSGAADEVVSEITARGGEAVASYASVTTSQGADGIIQTAVDSFGKIDILVNNAGILRDRMIWNMTDEEWDAVIKVHLYGHFYCTRAAIQRMRDEIREGRQRSGRIINFTSHSGIRGNPGQPNYAAAKMGVVGFTNSLALACERFGITCNAIAPRAITRLTDTIPDDRLRQLVKLRGIAGWDAPDIEDVKKKYLGGSPSAVAPLVAWLASDEAQHVTGRVFMMTEGAVGLFPKMEETKIAYTGGLFTVAEIAQVMENFIPKPSLG